MIFHGPNTYITPKWYAKNDVPTWNYAVVHMEGSFKRIENYSGIVECLQKLTGQIESHSPEPWPFWIPDDLATQKGLSSAIMGFRILVTDAKAKFKLSQNRSEVDRRQVIAGLDGRGDEASNKIARMMEQSLVQNDPNGK